MAEYLPPALEAARAAVEAHYPACAGAMVAGSVMRGEGTAASDLDIVVFFEEGRAAPHRASIVHAGWPVEFFAHTPKSHAYFLAQDRADGTGTLAHMTAFGVAMPQETPLIAARRAAAREVWEAGPPPLTPEEVEDRRYTLTELLDDLDPARGSLERFGALSRLYLKLSDFTLRAAGRWSAISQKTVFKTLCVPSINSCISSFFGSLSFLCVQRFLISDRY